MVYRVENENALMLCNFVSVRGGLSSGITFTTRRDKASANRATPNVILFANSSRIRMYYLQSQIAKPTATGGGARSRERLKFKILIFPTIRAHLKKSSIFRVPKSVE